MTQDKVRSLEEVVEIVGIHRRKLRGKIITMNGVFDIMHVGHARSLEEVSGLCTPNDLFIVGIDCDKYIKERKGLNRPYNNEKDRAELVARLNYAHYVTIFNFPDCRPFVEAIKPDVHANDEANPRPWLEEKTVIRNGGKLYTYKRHKDINGQDYSSTRLINKIKGESNE